MPKCDSRHWKHVDPFEFGTNEANRFDQHIHAQRVSPSCLVEVSTKREHTEEHNSATRFKHGWYNIIIYYKRLIIGWGKY